MAHSRVRDGWRRPDDNREDYLGEDRSSAVFAQSMAYVPSSIHTP